MIGVECFSKNKFSAFRTALKAENGHLAGLYWNYRYSFCFDFA